MLDAILPSDNRIRGAIVGLVGFGAVLAITQLLLPGTGDGGTPGAILFGGVVSGVLNALIAAGIVLIYRLSRVINFAQAALGATGGVFTYNFTVLNDWPFIFAFIAGLLVSAAIGLVIELVFIRRFFHASRLLLTVYTIALIGVLGFLAGYINAIPGLFPDPRDLTQDELLGRAPVPLPFRDFEFQVGEFPLSFGVEHFMAIVLSGLALIGLGIFIKYSRYGVAIRAVSQNPERAPMLGINSGTLSMIVWTIAGFLSGLGIIVNGAVTNSFTIGPAPPELLITALTAAVLARMRSLPVAVGAALGITMLREAVTFSYQDQVALLDVGLFVFIVVGLLLQREVRDRTGEAEVTTFKSIEEYRSTPQEMLQVGGVRAWRWVLIGVGGLAVLIFPWAADTRLTNLGGYIFLVIIAMLSLVVVTGWAGQASLGQWGLVAVGAILGGWLTNEMGINFWLALLVIPFVAAVFSLVIGLPALRIRGLYLAIATFAFAFAVRSALFREEWFGWLLPDDVVRPRLFLLDFDDERSMYYLTLGALLLCILIVVGLRRSRPGRVIIAVRENALNAQSFGVNIVRTRLAAFALSGWLCGFAGVLLAHHQRAVQGTSFEPQLSLDIFLFAVVGGVGSIAGVMLGAFYFLLRELLAGDPLWGPLVGQVGVLAILYVAPGGLASIFFGLRDAVLRIVAQRRRMVVPALFADLDPQAMLRKLIPLAEPIPNAGLLALPFSQRYKTSSELYGEEGWLTAQVKEEESEEEGALGAAAEAFGASETVQEERPESMGGTE